MRLSTVFKNKNALIVFWQSVFLSLSTFFFVVVLARTLHPEDFTTVNSLLGLFLIINVLVTAIQISATKFFIKNSGLPYSLWKLSIRLGIGFSLATVLLYPFWHRYFDWDLAITLLIAPAIGLPFLLAVRRGVLLAQSNFSGYARSMLIDNVLRLLGLPLVLLGPAGIAGLISISVLIAFLATPRSALTEERNFGARSMLATSTGIILLAITYNVDLLLVKHTLPPIEAAQYGIVNLIGKVPLALAAMITLYYLPQMISLQKLAEYRNAWKVARKALLLTTAGMILFISFMIIAGPLFVSLFFGSTYQNIGPSLALAVLPFCLLAMLGVLLNYFIAVDSHVHTLPLAIFVACEVIGFWILRSGYMQVLAYLLITTVMLYTIYIAMFILKRAHLK